MKPSVNDNNNFNWTFYFCLILPKYCTGTYLYLDRVGILIRRSPFCGCLCARQREEAWTFIGWLLTASHHSMSVFCLFLYRTHLHIGYDHWVAIMDERYIDPRYGKLPLAILGNINIFYISVQQVFGEVKWFSGESSHFFFYVYPLTLDFYQYAL